MGPPVWMPPGGYPAAEPVGVAPSKATDGLGILGVRNGALVAVVGALLSLGFEVLDLTGALPVSLVTTGAVVHVATDAVVLVLLLGVLGFIIDLVSLGFFRGGFRYLRPHDPRFSTTPTFALLAMIGVALAVLAFVALFAILIPTINCIASTPAGGNATTCVNVAGLLGVVGLILLAAILALVGFIGTLVGIWRLGARYHNDLFKVGAVLMIIPFASVVGSILVLIGAQSTLAQLPATAGPSYAVATPLPSPSYYPPPPPPGPPPA